METTLLVVLLLLNAGVVGVGIYLSAYLKKKAQNLATREEFEELQKQTAALDLFSGYQSLREQWR